MKNLYAAFMAVFFMLTTVGCGDDVETDPATTDVAVEVSEDADASEGEGEGEGEDVVDTDTGDDNTSDDSDTDDSSENRADGE